MSRHVPFRRRSKGDLENWTTLIEGVPIHLKASLREIVRELVSADPSLGGVLQRRLRLSISRFPTSEDLIFYAEHDPGSYLDIAEILVQEIWNLAHKSTTKYTAIYAANIVVRISRILDESNSAYQLEKFDENWKLTTRVDPVATQALQNAIELNPDAGELLGVAWRCCFQRVPNYDMAYDKAILAVESVATKLFTPNDPSPSLGKAIAHLGDTISRWTISGLDTDIQDSSKTLHGMLQTMWTAQNRHVVQGGLAPTPATKEEAESVLFLAIGIVQLFSRHLIKPQSE